MNCVSLYGENVIPSFINLSIGAYRFCLGLLIKYCFLCLLLVHSDRESDFDDNHNSHDEEQEVPHSEEEMDIDQAPEPEEGIGNAHDNEVPDPYPWRSFTEAALSLFFETSGISEATFSSLLEIISHESFKKEDVPPNVSALKNIRKKLPTVPISVHGEDSSFYYFDMEKTVAKTLENNKHMAKMTFVPVTNCHRDACNSRLFHESKLFGIQSIGTNVGKVTGR
ncbi:hypothetical protein SKAU_G00060700 [Synaphobranchus kaupii]|uniref:Uncharacterized protein n=1 Tax=Synaphobranchus kaupii TaxID=118154 RepID=A0A9Q1G4Y9_SYNKA|nr:hypothetical protein SKAU_G00060700 [Synaphobranchus kaupii]